MTKNKNVFVYWEGPMPPLIPVLFETMRKHIGKNHHLHILSDSTVNGYLKDIHPRYWDLSYTHKADYLRVNLVFEYGGIWLDADTLVREPLDGLFGLIKTHHGFFVREDGNLLCNGVFGAKKHNKLIGRWANRIDEILDKYPHQKGHISRTELGSKIINFIAENSNSALEGFHVIDGLNSIYPVNWDKCEEVYLSEDLSLLDEIDKPFQEVIVLVNSVYKALDNYHRTDLIRMNNVLGVLLRESLGDNYYQQLTPVCKKLKYTKTFIQFLDEYIEARPDKLILHTDRLDKVANVEQIFESFTDKCDEYIFSVSDPFQTIMNYNYVEHIVSAREVVDPDNICWYSPYTLSNLIRTYSNLKLVKLLYVKDKLVAICER